MPKYPIGELVYFIESNRFIRSGTIMRYSGGRYIISCAYTSGVKLPESRLYASREEAEKHVAQPAKEATQRPTDKCRPFWYADGIGK